MSTPEYPAAIWKPSPNHAKGRDGHKITAIVEHITGGAGGPSLAWLTNPAAKVSSHYLVMRDGTVYQLVQEGDVAWGCGLDFSRGYAAYKSDLAIPFVKRCWEYAINPNMEAINVEHEADAGQGLTEAQYQATLGLHRHLVSRHGLAVDGEHLIPHSAIDGVNRANDPGKTFPTARLFADLRASPLDLRALREHSSVLDALLARIASDTQEARDRVRAIWETYDLGAL